MRLLPLTLRLLLAVGIGLSLAACEPSGTVSPVPLSILPKDCELPVNGQIGLSINGVISPQAQVTWSAQRGLILRNPGDFGAWYTAPTEAGPDQITVTITPNYSGGTESLTLVCNVTGGESPSTSMPTQPAPTQPVPGGLPTIIISEVMSHPCGGDDYRKWNQYVELYNYGSQPVDVGGWFLFDEGERGTPDQLAAWGSRFESFNLALVTDTTVIPPGGFAVILSPLYPQAPHPHIMPYNILGGTIILTVSDESLGDDFFHILGSQPGFDTLTLFIGSQNVIHDVVDTYGTPSIASPYPQDIDDDRLDSFPYYLSPCTSIERIDPAASDAQSNWHAVPSGSPGDGPYR